MNPVPAPQVVGLVADDLTGAADAAVAFAERGWSVVLHLDLDRISNPRVWPAERPTVLAVSTGARALTDPDADAVTAEAVSRLRRAGADRIYLKVDSTVRGSVAGQISGAVRAWGGPTGAAPAVICPAFPEHHRTVVDGHVLVDGIPLDRTPAADDPVTPRTTSELTEIVPGGSCGGTDQIGNVERLILDAVDDADLDAIAAVLSTSPPEIIVVGSGGLAAALARRWSHPHPARTCLVSQPGVLVAASSLHPVTAAQLGHLRGTALAGRLEVLTAQALSTTPAAAAEELADRVAAALAARHHGALVAVGGDGAAAILRRLSAEQIIVDGAISGGCPTGLVVGGPAGGLRLVTKSGGFGDPATLTRIVTRLHSGAGDPRAGNTPDPEHSTPKDV